MRISESVRAMSPPRWTTSQAAETVGRSVDTLKRWAKEDIYRPSDSASFGSTVVPLYTEQDIEALKYLARTTKPGRKPKF